jgi:predicted enzyme involved in methoxymalonyl-ACP biosynthesis
MEEAILNVAAEHGRAIGAREILATYLPTERNRLCPESWRDRSGFTGESATFRWALTSPYPLRSQVSLELEVPTA